MLLRATLSRQAVQSVECGSDVILLRGSVRLCRARIAESGVPSLVVELRQIAGSALASGAVRAAVLCVLEPASCA
jgi:hypothetical protein